MSRFGNASEEVLSASFQQEVREIYVSRRVNVSFEEDGAEPVRNDGRVQNFRREEYPLFVIGR